MSCATCAAIPNELVANTGREDYLPASTRVLERYDLGSDDLWECPECRAFFLWVDDSQLSGSGNNDEERLSRIPEERAAILRACLHRDGAPLEETVARVEDSLVTLPEVGLLLPALEKRDRELAKALLPRLVRDLARTNDVRVEAGLSSYTYGKDGIGALLLKLLEETPCEGAAARATFDSLAKRCRQYLPRE